MPDPYFEIWAFPTSEGVYIGKNFIRNAQAIIAKQNTAYETDIKVLSFTIQIHFATNKFLSFRSNGAQIPGKVRRMFADLAEGDKVIFKDIVVSVGCESTNRFLTDSIVCEIKNGKAVRLR